MSLRPRGAHRASHGYPHDYLHDDRTWAESQRDVGGGLLIGAVTLVTLMALIVLGLV